MKIKKSLEEAEDLALVIVPQGHGYRVSEAYGRLIGSRLPIDQVDGLFRSRLTCSTRAFADGTGLAGCAFPAS